MDPLEDIQVLTPMQRGECGAVNLNQVLQEAMNPSALFYGEAGRNIDCMIKSCRSVMIMIRSL